MSAPSADELRACCVEAYSSPVARWLLGTSFHPGGERLTARLAEGLGVGPGARVADVASGQGTSAVLLARQTGCEVVGVDLSPQGVEAGRAAAGAAGLGERVTFLTGDAEALPLEDGSVDGVLSECALCTFPDKERALAEVRRVLRPGGRLALSDMTADVGALGPELRSVQAWVACVGGARPLPALVALIAGAGFEVEAAEAHDDALGELIASVELRLRAARLMAALAPPQLAGGVERGLELAARAREAIAEGLLGYGVVIARRPA